MNKLYVWRIEHTWSTEVAVALADSIEDAKRQIQETYTHPAAKRGVLLALAGRPEIYDPADPNQKFGVMMTG